MDAFEKMVIAMRQEGANKNPPRITLAEMTSATTCDTGKEVLNADDLYVAEHLVKHEMVADIAESKTLKAEMDSAGEPAHTHNVTKLTTKDTKLKVHSTLKKGDVVALYRLNDEKYLILDKVVSMDVSV